MSKQTVKQAFHALEERLKQITQENGYLTDVGHQVFTGFAADELEKDPVPPFLILQHGPTAIAAASGNKKTKLEYSPEVLIGTARNDGAEPLFDLEQDIRTCLLSDPVFAQTMEGRVMKMETPGQTPALLGDSYYALSVTPVTLTLIETYED